MSKALALLLASGQSEPPAPPTNGALYSWGAGVDNTIYKLGTGASNTRSSPVQVGALTDWLHLAVLENAVLAVKTDGTLWCWGTNGYGELGKGTTGTIYSSPSQVGALTNWKSVSGKFSSVGAIKVDGSLWVWGDGQYGGLGTGNTTSSSSPVQVGASYDWDSVSVGVWFMIGCKIDGTLWGWGVNSSGQLGVNSATTEFSSPVQIGTDADWFSASAGVEHCCAIRTDGTLWAWGLNTQGQLGTGNTTSRSSPVQVGALTDWVFVAAAQQSTFAIKADGTLWAWGMNANGQLGTGNTTNRSSPVQIGTDTNWRWVTTNLVTTFGGGSAALAIKADGTLWAWGTNGNGVFGTGDTVNRSSPVQVGAATHWTRVFLGGGAIGSKEGQTAIAVANSNGGPPALPDPFSAGYDLFVAGNNNKYALAYPVQRDFTRPFYIAAGQRWRSVNSLKDDNSYGIRGNGIAYACGLVNGGYRGASISTVAANPNSLGAMASSVAPGALVSKGKLYCWGSNTYGQVGNGTTTAKSSPVQIGALTTWLRVASNSRSTFAIKTDGTLWAWGDNSQGQLGLGNTTNYSSPVQVGALTNWQSIFIGSDTDDNTVMAVKTNGTLWGWGRNVGGRIGDGTTTDRSSPVQIGAATNWRKATLGFAINTSGQVYQLGLTNTLLSGTWLDVSSSGEHHAMVNAAGEVYTWGLNDRGQLGVGDYVDRSSPTQISVPRSAKAISCSEGTTIIMLVSTA